MSQDYFNSTGGGKKKDVTVQSDDGTLIDSETANQKPASVMYIPDEGFENDSMTLFDGEGQGSSSATDFSSAKKSGGRKSNLKASIQQLQYNENRIRLDRAINQTIEVLYELQHENKERPVFYPTNIENNTDTNALLNSTKAHLALVRKNSTISAKAVSKSKLETNDDIEFIPNFNVLKININLGHGHDNFIGNLDKEAIALLLEEKINHQVKHLLSLKDRIDDTSSKVFVTGDLNAGKSTFCNALLKRKVLPEDQQPCTNVFCEVVDAKENRGVEEVHAVYIGSEYDIKDESTYKLYSLKDLEDLVYESDKYSLLKVYVNDKRSVDQSLLKNGIIDIKLIDAPGLNMDSYQTTQVFSTQEEIDLVVFVVNAENHFTLSAKEFIAAAANEKRFIFIVVNKFDNIKNKDRCMSKILDQVQKLSPDTHKDAREFVHFISSSEVLDNLPDGGDDGDDGDDVNNDDYNPDYSNPDFDHLEASLRRFVLEKRSISKLSPAKTYLLKLLDDLMRLSEINEKMYSQDKQERVNELNEITPQYEDTMKKSHDINEKINKVIENVTTDVYNHSRDNILKTINEIGDHPIVPYQGIQFLYEYALETQNRMFEAILTAVTKSEDYAKTKTSDCVSQIKEMGKDSLGDEFLADKVFREDLMFTRRRDTIKRKLDETIAIQDFFDPSIENFIVSIGLPAHILPSALPLPNITGLISGIPTTSTELTKWSSNNLGLATIYSSTKLITLGACVRKFYVATQYISPGLVKKMAIPTLISIGAITILYLINDLPNAFARNFARKLRTQITELDYPHINSDRISKECRAVLNFPYRQVMNAFQTSIDKNTIKKEKLLKNIKDANLSFTYFNSLTSKINEQKLFVQKTDLESIYTVD